MAGILAVQHWLACLFLLIYKVHFQFLLAFNIIYIILIDPRSFCV